MLVNLIEFFKEHSVALITLWSALITVAYIIVKLTPTRKDDVVFKTVFGILKALKMTPELPDTLKKELEQVEAELEDEVNEMDDDRTRDSIIGSLK